MAEVEFEKLMGGRWDFDRDENMEDFLEAVESSPEARDLVLGVRPSINNSINNDVFHCSILPFPDQTEERVDVTFKLGEKFIFETQVHKLEITPEWKEGKLIQHITSLKGSGKPHTITMSLENGELVATHDVDGVIGKRIYRRSSSE